MWSLQTYFLVVHWIQTFRNHTAEQTAGRRSGKEVVANTVRISPRPRYSRCSVHCKKNHRSSLGFQRRKSDFSCIGLGESFWFNITRRLNYSIAEVWVPLTVHRDDCCHLLWTAICCVRQWPDIRSTHAVFWHMPRLPFIAILVRHGHDRAFTGCEKLQTDPVDKLSDCTMINELVYADDTSVSYTHLTLPTILLV